MKLSIVILSYNTKDLTLSCIKSVISQYKKEIDEKEVEIIVVDNNSHDISVGEIRNYISSIKYEEKISLIESKENLGFGGGCNLGAKSAKGKDLLFLNSDTEVLGKGFLSMTEFLEKNLEIGILGGKIVNDDGSVQKSCGKFYSLFNLLIALLGLERFGFLRSSPSVIEKVDWVSGACMMFKENVFVKLGGFDEKMFMYMEDMEICLRAKEIGFLTYFYPDLSLKHKSHGSSNRTFAIINIYKGILYFYSKHKTHQEYLIAKFLLYVKARILIIVGFLTFNYDLRDRYRKAIA